MTKWTVVAAGAWLLAACAPPPKAPPSAPSDAERRAREREARDKEAQEKDDKALNDALESMKRDRDPDYWKVEMRKTKGQAPLSPFPKKVSGFPFSTPPDQVADTCGKTGFPPALSNHKGEVLPRMPWSDVKMVACFKEREETGFSPLGVINRICPSGLSCEVVLLMHEDDADPVAVGKIMSRASRRLWEKYGPPRFEEGKSFGDAAVSCAAGQGPKSRREIWTWVDDGKPVGRMLLVTTCERGDQHPVSSLIYQNSEGVIERLRDAANKEQNY